MFINCKTSGSDPQEFLLHLPSVAGLSRGLDLEVPYRCSARLWQDYAVGVAAGMKAAGDEHQSISQH
jgi:hypothetical protein